MTQEDKELLLLKDLSARLQYGVYIRYGINGIAILTGIEYMIHPKRWIIITEGSGHYLYDIKPYLRPMSSMTEEEKKEAKENGCIIYHGTSPKNRGLMVIASPKGIDWLNKHHFDYRGLISMGLALEAPDGMYKF